MKYVLSTRRFLSVQPVRRPEDWRRVTSSTRTSPVPLQREMDGRTYLIPTIKITRPLQTDIKSTSSTYAKRTPVVLDLQQVSSDGSPHCQPIKKHELEAELKTIQNAGYLAIGITNASDDVKRIATQLRLPSFLSSQFIPTTTIEDEQFYTTADNPIQVSESQTTDRINEKEIINSQETNLNGTNISTLSPPLVISSSVRSGQQIFGQNRSVIILGNVNSGAEVLSDDSIHIFGALKGRALAGISGCKEAQIVCQKFDAELVSIASHFTTCENLEKDSKVHPGQPTIISIKDNELHFESSTTM